MIEIPEPPDIQACASCMSVLVWLYSHRKSAWVSFAREPTDPDLLRVHRCRGRDSRLPSWRDRRPWGTADPGQVERVHRGAAMAAAAIRRPDPPDHDAAVTVARGDIRRYSKDVATAFDQGGDHGEP